MAALSARLPASAAWHAPDADQIAAMGSHILAGLPVELRNLVGMIPIRVQDWADEATLAEMGIEDALELSGLYRGIPLAERIHAGLPPAEPEMIFLYRMPILFEWCERGCALEDVVFDVLTHEIGHHFGMNEEEVLRMEDRGGEE
ncbi:metallopeptidase family protein [Geminicoccaceae bacterium 1502E]|nr:metallopeptidase family protein [Geminicoccaceae bacterium 1502E]